MVVFRLTQEEYTSLRDACKSKGGRNLSEFTRSELLAMLRSESIAALIQSRFHELESRIAQLESAVTHLTELVACGVRAAAAPPGRQRVPGTD
jgi:hypothetical protein